MRILLLLRGCPGVGKSTYIKEHGLKDYALSADDIRLLSQSPVLDTEGKPCIGTDHEKFVWETLFKILEFRMDRGEFTVIDATNSKTSEINKYKDLANKYRYRMFCVDMTKVPIEECKRRNLTRPLLKQVPEAAIEKVYSRFATQKIPTGVKVVEYTGDFETDQKELEDKVYIKKFDFNEYKRIHHIGDIHGCYTALKEYFDSVGGIKEDEFYIFTGDFLDRGIENVEVLKFLISIMDYKNVLLLDGNHETHIRAYANGEISRGKEFELITKPQIEASDIDMKDIRMFCRKIGQVAYYEYDGKTVLVNHGGVSNIPDQLTFIPTIQFIKGVGNYNDFEKIAQSFDKNTDSNTYQIYGHRNTKSAPIKISERCFNLEGKVEFGGYLRVVQLDKEGFHTVEIKNNIFREEKEVTNNRLLNSSIADIILELRKNKWVQEKKFGNISSFNFTRDAFMKEHWDRQTVLARGLYINTAEGYILARGYEKFFKINEMEETKIERLEQKLKFPVYLYKKENGYLGLVSYNPETDDFFITTKSNPEGEYADWLKEAFYKQFEGKENLLEELKQYLKENNLTMAFENVDMDRDPHIIDYGKNHLFLLDLIKNDIVFNKIAYSKLLIFADHFGFECKTKAKEIYNWQDFFDFYMKETEKTEETCEKDIEGWVIEDSNGYMIKLKNQYYNFWKFMRGLSHEVIRKGYTEKTSALVTPLANMYYGWLKELAATYPTKEERCNEIPTNIITLRNMFLEVHPEFK